MRIAAILACVIALSVPLWTSAAPLKVSASPTKPAGTFFRGSPLPKWAKPLPAIPPSASSAPVVIRLADSQAWTGAKPAVLVTRAIQVNDKAHLGDIGQYSLNYSPAYQRLFLHRVAILRGDQVIERTSTVDIRTMEREPSLENGFYDGEATVSLLLQDVRVNDTLLIAYSIEGRNPVLGDVWTGEFMWDAPAPVELRRLVVSHPAGRPLHWRELGSAKPHSLQPVTEREGAVERLVFEERALAAVEMEPSVPSDFFSMRAIQASEYASWHDVAAWGAALFTHAKESKNVAAVARQFEHGGTEVARASAALHWVQDEIRYFSVALGENSHRPQAPDVVLERRYGDCKDKSNLLIALLDRLGIRAEPVLVSSSAPLVPQQLLPSPAWFDHVIVRVHADGKTFFVDPTREGEKGDISSLPVALGGAAGLVASATSDGLVTIPEDIDFLPQITRNEKFVIASMDGDAVLETRIRYRGNFARYARQRFQSISMSERRKNLLSDYEKQFPGVALQGDPVLHDSDDGASFEVEARFLLPKPLKRKDGWYSIDHDSKVLEGSLGIPDKLVREYPFQLPLGMYRARYRLQVLWPKEVRLLARDEASTIDNAFFHAHKEYSWRDNFVDYEIDYDIKRKRIEAAELPQMEAQSQLLQSWFQSALKVNEVSLVKPEAAALSDRDGSVLRMMVATSTFADELETGKSGAGDEFALLCEALQSTPVLVPLLPSAIALDDALTKRFAAAKADQSDKETCRVQIAFASGDFQTALAHQAGAKLKDDDLLTLDLAWMNLIEGKLDAAKSDTERFLAARWKNGTLAPAEAAQVVALLERLGQAVPARLHDYIESGIAGKASNDYVWPRPVLAYRSGVLTQEQLLASIEQLPPGAREPALGEAWFHIGQQALVNGRTDRALEAFRWLRLHGVRNTSFYTLALAELERIERHDPDYLKGVDAVDAKRYGEAREYLSKAVARGVAAAYHQLGALYENGHGVAKDGKLAFHWYLEGAQRGDPDAMNNLAICYDEGIGVEKDLKASLEWFERAAKYGHFYASRNIGRRYLYGYSGVTRDVGKALPYLHDAAELGNVEAQQMLADLYADPVAGQKDYVQAFFWSGLAADKGDTEAMSTLAFLFAYGHGVPEDIPRAIALYRRAADKGSSSAQTQLGNAYALGRGVEKNPREAFRWFSKAMDKNPYAKERVGEAYLYGDGTNADVDQAIKLLTDGHPDNAAAVCHGLVRVYVKGREGEPGWRKAVELMRKGAEQGEASCQLNIALMLEFGRGLPLDPAQAAAWYRKAADQGVAVALNNLADQYEHGNGVPADIVQAISLYRQAAQKGDATSMLSLGELLEAGKGIKADPYLACVYYHLASKLGERRAQEALDRLGKTLAPEEVGRAKSAAWQWDKSKPLPDEA